MKKLLLIAALAALSNPAFASKARLNALGNAEHLIDTQTTFNNPSHMAWMGDYITFETGPTNPTYTSTAVPTNTAGAEGGFVRSSGDAKYMAYLGRKSDFTSAARPSLGFLGQENPIELQYGMKGAMNWGVGLNYSSADKKSTQQKQTAFGVRAGASTETWEAAATIGLGSEATGNTAIVASGLSADADAKYKGTTGLKLGGAYKMENIYLYAKYYQDGFKYESTVNTLIDGFKKNQSQVDLGVVDHNKIDGGQWFYGVALRMFESKAEGATGAAATTLNKKTNTTTLPFLLGLEYDATSWATLRASATQNVLISSTKTETNGASGETDTVDNSTAVGAGVALHFNKFIVDGSWTASNTGDVGTDAIMTHVALTYSF